MSENNSELLPCPMCGESKGYVLHEGSTYRWWNVVCNGCGRIIDECSSDGRTVLHEKLPEKWVAAVFAKLLHL